MHVPQATLWKCTIRLSPHMIPSVTMSHTWLGLPSHGRTRTWEKPDGIAADRHPCRVCDMMVTRTLSSACAAGAENNVKTDAKAAAVLRKNLILITSALHIDDVL